MAEETEAPKPEAPKPAAPAAPPKPPARTLEEILADPIVAPGAARAREGIVAATEFAGEISLRVRFEKIRDVARAFKEAGYRYLVDLTAVDYSQYPGYKGLRFAVVYLMYSHEQNARLRLKVYIPDGVPVPSVSSVWKTANWFEREVFDMFGVEFEGHPNLERILMWEGFRGNPLRKDFPVRGIETGARIYPEIFPPGGGPREGSTGKDPKDVNILRQEWDIPGRTPVVALKGKVEKHEGES